MQENERTIKTDTPRDQQHFCNNPDDTQPVSKMELYDENPAPTGANESTDPPTPKNNYKPSNTNNMSDYNFEQVNPDKEIILKRIEQEHELRLRKEDREDSELALRREQLRLERLKLDLPGHQKKQEEKSLHWDMMHFFRKELELIEDTDNEIEISLEELQDKIARLKQLIERLEKHCFKYDYEVEDLAYHSNLTQMLRYFNNLYAENEPEEIDDDEDDEEYEDDEDTNEILIAYAYDTKGIDRIRMLTRAEFGTEIQDM